MEHFLDSAVDIAIAVVPQGILLRHSVAGIAVQSVPLTDWPHAGRSAHNPTTRTSVRRFHLGYRHDRADRGSGRLPSHSCSSGMVGRSDLKE